MNMNQGTASAAFFIYFVDIIDRGVLLILVMQQLDFNPLTSISDDNVFSHVTLMGGGRLNSLLLNRPDYQKRVMITPIQYLLMSSLLESYTDGISNQEAFFNRRNISRLSEKLDTLFEMEKYKLAVFSSYNKGYSLRVVRQDDPHKKKSFLLGGDYLTLADAPHRVLRTLCRNFGSVVAEADLGASADPKSSQARSYICRIKKEFECANVKDFKIVNIRGWGYMLQHSRDHDKRAPVYNSDPHRHMLFSSPLIN